MDSGGSIAQIIIYVIFLFCGAYCAAAESSFSSMNKVRVELLADEGNKKAKKAIRIFDKFEKALTTLLICTNIAHIGCASLSTIIAIDLWGGVFGDESAAAYATVATTIIVFLVSEMIPKSFAKANADKVAIAFAPSLAALMWLWTPVSFFFGSISTLFTKLFPAKDEPTYSEDELVTLIETVSEEGVIDGDSSEILQSAIEFSSTTVKTVMTVKDDIFAIDVRAPIEQIKQSITESGFSRIPVYDGDINKIIGIVNVRTFLKAYINKGKFNIRTIMTKPCFTSPEAPIDELFDKMRRNKIYMAVIRDENTKTLGIATIEDFLEEIVGEIFDENDEVNENFIKLGGFNYEVSAHMNVGELFSLLRHRPSRPSVMAKSVQVWVSEVLGHSPEEDEVFIYDDALEVRITEVCDGSIVRVEIKQLDREKELLDSAAVSSDTGAYSKSKEEAK